MFRNPYRVTTISFVTTGLALLFMFLAIDLGAEDNRTKRIKRRKVQRQLEYTRVQEAEMKGFRRDEVSRLSEKLSSERERITGVRVRDQKCLAGLMHRERRERKEGEERLLKRSELERMIRARIIREREEEAAKDALERQRKKKKRMF